MKKIFLILIVFVIPFVLSAQSVKPAQEDDKKKDKENKDKEKNIIAPNPKADDGDKKFGIKFSGFVKGDYMFDSRQTVAAREGHFLLYPAAEVIDANGTDINAVPNYNALAIQTRLKGTITGPDAFGAKTSGVIEGAFFGHTNADVNGFRLRHAFVKLNWEKFEILAGQYWHPMFVTGCYPGTISFNTGVPFQPFSRNPQLRLSYKVGPINIIAAAVSQRDFTSAGGSTALRNSAIPDAQLQIQFQTETILAGVGGGYKTLVPRLITSNLVNGKLISASHESVSSLSGQVYFKFKHDFFTVKLEGILGQNMTDLLMLGGYAVHDITNTTYDYREYTTMDVGSIWLDVHTNPGKIEVGKGDIQIGLFAGFTQNLGSLKEVDFWNNAAGVNPSSSASGTNIDYVYRFSPRVIYASGKVSFALECEYTTAAYSEKGTYNAYYQVMDAKEVSNIRGLLSVIYKF